MAKCGLCLKFDDCPFRYDPDAQCSEFERKPMTNGDRIRTMTDEELANKILTVMRGWCPIHSSDCKCTCAECVLNWLKQEATDEHS